MKRPLVRGRASRSRDTTVVGDGNKFRVKRVIVVAPIKVTRTRSAGSVTAPVSFQVYHDPVRVRVLAVTMQMHLPGIVWARFA